MHRTTWSTDDEGAPDDFRSSKTHTQEAQQQLGMRRTTTTTISVQKEQQTLIVVVLVCINGAPSEQRTPLGKCYDEVIKVNFN